jgi:predicted transcriptional regulator
MTADDIAAILARKLPDPLEPVYRITRLDSLKVLAAQLGSEALFLTDQEIALFHTEVQAVFEHYIDERELYQLALQQFSITRNL